ncbi:putative transcriptional regulator [Bacillus phage BC-T25]|nr:putative transcriptional regulator [Bacillus phage BC-T25]
MEYGVYLESSVVDIKPKVLELLTKLVEKAKQASEYVLSFTKKELSEDFGKDVRTTSRYLKELESRKIIQLKGKRGRGGGTVIMFNSDLIRFETSDNALVNSEEPLSIDDVLEKKLPSKKKAPKEKKRNRRTKKQMLEAQVLQKKHQNNLDEINDRLVEQGGKPKWSWFEQLENPVDDYRTYLLSRLYNRYAVLFTDGHNFDVRKGLKDADEVQMISEKYDVLPERFYGSVRWAQFEKFREFCDENGIDPAVYLSAQFNRSIFDATTRKSKKILPFVNALISDTSYEVFAQYCGFQQQYSATYRSCQQIPAKFVNDFVVRAIRDGYNVKTKGKGLWQYKAAITDFFNEEGFGDVEHALLDFYDMVDDNLRAEKVSFKTRNTIKKFIMLQSLIQTGGAQNLPEHIILGSEMTQIMLATIQRGATPGNSVRWKYEWSLGRLAHPTETEDVQKSIGCDLYYRMVALEETYDVLRLIMEFQGVYLSLVDLQEAFKEYGKTKVPVDEFSMLDVDQIVKFMDKVEAEGVDHDAITNKKTWELEGSIANQESLDDLIENRID